MLLLIDWMALLMLLNLNCCLLVYLFCGFVGFDLGFFDYFGVVF